MLFDRSLSIFSTTYLKQNMEFFNLRFKIQLDLPVETVHKDGRGFVGGKCGLTSDAAS